MRTNDNYTMDHVLIKVIGTVLFLFMIISCETMPDNFWNSHNKHEKGDQPQPAKEWCEDASYENYGQCIEEWAQGVNHDAIRLVNTGENLPVDSVISKDSCIYSFDAGSGCYRGHYHHDDLGASAPVVVDAPTYSADKAFRYFIPGNDSGGDGNSYRSSLTFNEEWRETQNWQGTEHWLGWAIRLDEDFPYPAPGWNVTMQFHSLSWLEGNDQLSPVWAIRTESDGQWRLTRDNPLDNPNADLGSYENDRGEWIEWVVHIKYDCEPNGFTRVWKDGQLVYQEFDIETYNCTDTNLGYYLPGLYNSYMRYNNAPDMEAVISDFRIADETGNFFTVSPGNH